MPGPQPKDPAIRQRRNKAATRAELAGEPLRRVPPIGKGEWQPQTRAWWRDVWRSPMAAQFLAADVHALRRLLVLIEAFWRDPTKELAAEIRQQEARFGLTPLDRRRLEWTIEAPAPKKAAPVEAANVEPEEDPRKLFQVVR